MSCKLHKPTIVSRYGGPTLEELNVCGDCGFYLAYNERTFIWYAISDEEAQTIREKYKGKL